MIRFINIRHIAGDREIFSGLSWHVKPGERVALVGDNGTGKTTLLRMAAGETEPTDGEIIVRRNLRVGYLRQEIHTYSEGATPLLEAMKAFEEEQAAAAEVHRLYDSLQTAPDSEHEAILSAVHALETRVLHHDAASAEVDARKVLLGLGFTQDGLGRPLCEFSGGWQMRAHIARLLLERPDLLMLDEPTNHLDLESITWLEQYLAGFQGAIVIVSHDRTFLDRITSRTAWLYQKKVRAFTGNYSSFLTQRAEEEDLLLRRYQNQQEEIARIQLFIDRFRYKATKAAAVQSRVKMLEKMERIELPPGIRRVRLRLPDPHPCGRQVLDLRDVSMAYGDNHVFSGVNLQVEFGGKIALVGPNGAGKSTLLKICAGLLEHGGERCLHSRVQLEYFSQHRVDMLNPQNTVLEEARPPGASQTDEELRSLLGCFLFTGDDVFKPVHVLSGGEKSRLALARMMLRRGNLLLLDEPTNHLDIATREVLAAALKAFPGSIVMISHDRSFIDGIVDRIVEVGGGGIRVYLGNYSDYMWKKQSDAAAAAETGAAAAPSAAEPKREARRVTADERRDRATRRNAVKSELNRVQAEIESKETRLAAIHALQADPDAYASGRITAETAAEGRALEKELPDLIARWEELVEEYEQCRSTASAP